MTLFQEFLLLLATSLVAQISLCAPRDEGYTVEKANDYIAANKDAINQTYRLKYHLMAPIGWINDPNGFIYFRGEYHLFYQYNPYGALWSTMHWGHAKSKDLVNWEDLPVAMAPDQSYDNDGVFSGSAIEKDGKLYVMYTGTHGDEQVQCIAYSEDGIHFEKVQENPVLDASSLPANAQSQDFRDPKVFQRGDFYYVVIVSKTLKQTGQVLLYQSADLIKWDFKSILLEGTPEQGVMWECPDLFELDGKDVLLLSAIEMPKSGDDYQNYDSVIEFIGTIDWDAGKFQVEYTKELDHGLDFYATQTTTDDEGRRILVAWMNMWQRNFPTADLGHGWTGSMVLPRVLKIENDYLVQTPIEDFSNRSTRRTHLNNVILSDESKEFNDVTGEVSVLELKVNLEEASLFEIDLRIVEEEETVLRYNTRSNELTFDRTKSGYKIVGVEKPPLLSRKVLVPLEDNKLKLQIFLDKSSIEVFASDGKESFSSTIFPTKKPSDKIRFKAEGKALIESLTCSQIE